MDITQDNGLLLVIIIEPIIRKEELFEVFFSLSLSQFLFISIHSHLLIRIDKIEDFEMRICQV